MTPGNGTEGYNKWFTHTPPPATDDLRVRFYSSRLERTLGIPLGHRKQFPLSLSTGAHRHPEPRQNSTSSKRDFARRCQKNLPLDHNCCPLSP